MKEFLIQFVTAQRAAGVKTLREIHHALTAPGEQLATRTVPEAKPAARIEYEQATAGAIVNLGSLIAPDLRPQALLARVATMTEPEIKAAVMKALAAADFDRKLAITVSVLAVLSSLAARESYGVAWPPAADFGQPTLEREEITRTPTPSPWAAAFPDKPAPTLNQFREFLQ